MHLRKKLDKFEIKLPTSLSGQEKAKPYRTFGYSPLHALSNLLRRYDRTDLVDGLYTEFQNGNEEIDISMHTYGEKPESTRGLPELDRMRRSVANMTGLKLTNLEGMRYSDLYRIYKKMPLPATNGDSIAKRKLTASQEMAARHYAEIDGVPDVSFDTLCAQRDRA